MQLFSADIIEFPVTTVVKLQAPLKKHDEIELGESPSIQHITCNTYILDELTY